MNKYSFLVVSVALILAALMLMYLNEMSNKVEVLYLAQERAEKAAESQLENGKLLEAQKK